LFEEAEPEAKEDSEIMSETQSSSGELKWLDDRILAIEKRADETYHEKIKGKYLHLEGERQRENFKKDLKVQKNRLLWLFSSANDGIETYMDLKKELDKIKLTLHQYALSEVSTKRLEKFRRQVENYIELYAKVNLRNFFNH